MTGGRTSGGRSVTDAECALETRAHVADVVASELETREAAAFVHVGTGRDPGVRYCRPSLDPQRDERRVSAVAFDGTEWLVRSADDSSAHPADRLATALADRGLEGTILTPPQVPHDAALYLEQAGFELASTDVLERARATKTAGERARIASAQRAASAGVQRAAAVLADATTVDGRLVVADEPLTAPRLRLEIDEAIVAAGAFPAGNTAVDPDTTDALRPGEPIVIAVAPRGPDGYHGGLVRTLVVDGDGGRERRSHVAVTQAFRSSRAMLTADTESVTAVEADLEAEMRAFGEDDAIETRVTGVGLEPRERPVAGGEEIAPGSVVRLEAAVRLADEPDERWLRLADVLVKTADGVEWLASPSRSLEPANVLDDGA